LSGAAESARLFFAVWPSAAAAIQLAKVAQRAHGFCGGRAMREETLHLTLAFLGEVPAAKQDEARRAANNVQAAPFQVKLDRLAYWRHNRIVHAGGDCPDLVSLAAKLAANLRERGFALDARPFAAHATLVRDAVCPEPPAIAFDIRWPVAEFVLARSRRSADGAGYAIVGRWPLIG
jgi:2'-5' RNA ligase